MDTVNDPRLSVGGNSPPDPIEDLRAQLRETHGPLIERSADLVGMAERLPPGCDDDEIAAKLMNAIKACTAFTKNAEAARVAAKEPHQAAGRAVDGFFKKLSDPVDALKMSMSRLLTDFQRRKADEERRRREAEANEARRIAAEEQRLAREAQARATEERRLAEEAERQAREARTAAERETARLAKESADRAAAEAREAKDKAAAAKQDANTAREESRVKPAELTRERTDLGAVASLRTVWEFSIEDASQVPRTYCTPSEKAIRLAIRAATMPDGTCPLRIPGVKIYPSTNSVVR